MRQTKISDLRPNPLRDLIAEHQRSAHDRQTSEKLRSELPALIDDQVAEQVQELEDQLLRNFKRLRKEALERSTAVLTAQLNERISNLEQVSSLQAQTIGNLRESSEMAERKIGSVVHAIETTLSYSVPGFRLLNAETQQKSEPAELKGEQGSCPKCLASEIRRSHRRGLWDEFVRLFLLAPYRCSKCRHRFYRF